MKRNSMWILLFVLPMLAGCSKQQIYSSTPVMQTVSTSSFEVKLEPLQAEGYNYFNRFRYQFTNKTDGDLILDWSETFYLRNGKRYGNFGWEGLTFEELREIKEQPDTTIAPGKRDAIEIFPLKLIGWKEEGIRMKAMTPEAGFTHTPFPEGENGMSIAVLKDGKLLRKNILLNIKLD